MRKLIKNDYELTDQLMGFFKRVRSACDYATPEGKYLAFAAKALSEQDSAFFSSLTVSSYGHLDPPCTNNLPYGVIYDKLSSSVMSFVDASRVAIAANNDAAENFTPSEHLQKILDPAWRVSDYGLKINEEHCQIIGKRHPYRIAQEALRGAAKRNTDKLYDKALYAIESYILIDTSLYESFKRIALCYNELWEESDIMAPCSLSILAQQFDPYDKKSNPELDYRYKEKLITPELIIDIANYL